MYEIISTNSNWKVENNEVIWNIKFNLFKYKLQGFIKYMHYPLLQAYIIPLASSLLKENCKYVQV